MSDEPGSRQIEMHFAADDEAIAVEVDDGDGGAVDDLLRALDAVDVDEAEAILRNGARHARRIGPQRQA